MWWSSVFCRKQWRVAKTVERDRSPVAAYPNKIGATEILAMGQSNVLRTGDRPRSGSLAIGAVAEQALQRLLVLDAERLQRLGALFRSECNIL